MGCKEKIKNRKFNNLIIVVTGVVLVGIVVVSVIVGNFNKNSLYTLELNGDTSVVVYKDSSYDDPGAKVYDVDNNDYSNQIVVESNLNLKKIGRYEIIYKFNDIYVKRIVRVIDKPNVSSNESNSDNNDKNGETILKLKGSEIVYIDIYGNYTEEGFSAIDSVDGNISKKVKVTHNVDNSKAGTYQVVYTVKNSSGVTTSVSRKIIVMSVELKLSLNNSNYTNEKVLINVSVNDEYFNYLMLPDGRTITSRNYTYEVNENGTYNFKLYNKHGVVREKSITVKNIDRAIPSGSCSGSYKDGGSTIKVIASDNVGISKYVVNGNSYTSNIIKINKEILSVKVDIYDKAGNKTSVSCNLDDSNLYSDKSITFNYQFIADDNIPYGLYTPSSAKGNSKTPLIVWLHGSGSVGASHDRFKKNFLSFMKDWKLEGFNAYIVCPLLSSGSWNIEKSKTRVYKLIDKIIKEKNINTDKIILAGHSMGAQGIYNIADGKLDYYSALVFMSPYSQTPSSIDINQFKALPLIGYVGTIEAGEDSKSYKYATKKFANAYGKDKLIIINSDHGSLPKKVFNIDANKDNKSDLIEWMLRQ